MEPTQAQYVTDDTGRRVAVLIGIERYNQLLEAAEEIESLRAYDAAKQSNDVAISFDQAVKEIEQGRKSQ